MGECRLLELDQRSFGSPGPIVIGGVLNTKVSVKFVDSLVGVNSLALRATVGGLKGSCVMTRATTQGLARVFVVVFAMFKGAVTACYKRGLKTKGVSQVGGKV